MNWGASGIALGSIARLGAGTGARRTDTAGDPLGSDAAHGSIAAIAPNVVKPAIDARLAFSPSGRPEIVPDVTGTRLDYIATESMLAERIAFAGDPVPMVTRDDPANVTAASLAPNLPEADAAVDAPLILSFDDAVWHIPPENLRLLLGVDPATSNLRVDRRPLYSLVAGLAAEIDRDAVDASITVDETAGWRWFRPSRRRGWTSTRRSRRSRRDFSARTRSRWWSTRRQPISDAMAAAAVERGEDLLDPGISLTWEVVKGNSTGEICCAH